MYICDFSHDEEQKRGAELVTEEVNRIAAMRGLANVHIRWLFTEKSFDNELYMLEIKHGNRSAQGVFSAEEMTGHLDGASTLRTNDKLMNLIRGLSV